MIVVVDTSVLIDHLRNSPRAVDRLLSAARQGDDVWSVSVVRTEIYAGALPGEDEEIAALFERLRWVDATPDLADRAGRLAATYRRSHSGIDVVDFLVAAATQALEAQLLTMNVKHFPMFPDLTPAY